MIVMLAMGNNRSPIGATPTSEHAYTHTHTHKTPGVNPNCHCVSVPPTLHHRIRASLCGTTQRTSSRVAQCASRTRFHVSDAQEQIDSTSITAGHYTVHRGSFQSTPGMWEDQVNQPRQSSGHPAQTPPPLQMHHQNSPIQLR